VKLRIVCISDTHGRHNEMDIPYGDILLHAGDFTMKGTIPEIVNFSEFFKNQPHKHKIVIAGNHDFLFQDQPEIAQTLLWVGLEDNYGVTYLQDSSTMVEGLLIWGAPWQPWFHDWAFNLERGHELKSKWSLIPDDTDILITHGPPAHALDRCTQGNERVGCVDLMDRIKEVKPKLHLFGHIHEDYGMVQREHTMFVNACNCNLQYSTVNKAVVLDWDTEDGSICLVRPEFPA